MEEKSKIGFSSDGSFHASRAHYFYKALFIDEMKGTGTGSTLKRTEEKERERDSHSIIRLPAAIKLDPATHDHQASHSDLFQSRERMGGNSFLQAR